MSKNRIKFQMPGPVRSGRSGRACNYAVCGLVAAFLGPSVALAGNFNFDWAVIDWPAGNRGPLTFTLVDQYGFTLDATITTAGGPYANVSGISAPDDLTIFGGNQESLVILGDAGSQGGSIGESTITTTLSFANAGTPFAVDSLAYEVTDIDASDNNNNADRCDFVTVTGDSGAPALSAVSPTPTFVIGPGVGSGNTGLIDANQAQCIYVNGFGSSPTSPNDNTGSLQVSHPDGTTSVSVTYDESIGNVRGFTFGEDPAARGIGVYSATFFTVDQSISLSRSVSPASGVAGSNVTYSYVITNNGELPFNPTQDVVIEDSKLGTVSCPAITADIAPGGTLTCTADYTVTAADVLAGSVDSDATAGIGTIGQGFAGRLQSTTETINLITSATGGGGGGAAPLVCTPRSVSDQPRTQLAGPGNASNVDPADIYLFDNVTTDSFGNPIDVLFQLEQVSNATELEVVAGIEARMVPAENGFVTFKLSLVEDGSATVANPTGTPISQSAINGVIVQQTDVDSRGNGDDSSDVGGTLDGNPSITYVSTAPLASFPAPGSAIAMDPAKVGDPTNWLEEPNESNFDNYIVYQFETFTESRFIHGYTGTSTISAQRGSDYQLCAISATSTNVVATDDDYTATPINTVFGGSAGEVLANDTIDGVTPSPLTSTLEVLVPATPQSSGDPVPFVETSGLDAGRVVVPAGTPAGNYTIDYKLCEATAPDNCDRARVTVGVFEGQGLDFGDAPVSYLNASHVQNGPAAVYLGTIPPDTEVVPQSDATATADDLIDADDEDSVTFPVLTQGAASTVDVAVTGAGVLQAWLDFNGDGVFGDVLAERIATDLRDDGLNGDTLAGDGVIQVVVDVPTDATTSTTFARFRFATDPIATAGGLALDGEVEDYSLVIAAADLVDRGDAPSSYGDPRHIVVPSIYLGAGLPDTELTTQFSANADADDLIAADDEDAIASIPVMSAGSTFPITVVTHETLSNAYDAGLPVLSAGITNLQMWIDFNQNGVFDPAEQVATDFRDGGTGDADGTFNNQIIVNVTVPADVGNGQSFLRVRWSTSSAVTSDPFDGLNADGEVEDYSVTLSNPDGPLVCDTGFYMVYESGNQPILEKLQITGTSGSYTLARTTYPPDFTGSYNTTGWGWSEVDNYIYGILRNTFQLHRVTFSGAMQPVIDMSSLGLARVGSTLEILPNGVMVYNDLDQRGRYQLVDISDPLNPVNLGVLDAGGSAPNGLDMTYNPRDGLLYMFANGRDLYAMDPRGGTAGATTTTLVTSNIPLPPGFSNSQLDSVFFDENGFMYGYDNISRQIFGLEVGAAGSRPAGYQFFAVDGTGSAPIGNDGASCRKGSFYASAVFQEGSISGTLYEDVDGSDSLTASDSALGAAISVLVYDDADTAANLADDTLIRAVETAADGTFSVSGLDATLTYRIEVDTADPDFPAGLSAGTANPIAGVVVTAGAETSGQDFGFDTVAAQADLSLAKQARSVVDGSALSEAAIGDEIDFVLSLSNAGPGLATGVQVRDLIPDGFVYVSDDAAANGDSYDSATGMWVLGDVASGATETLSIRVTMQAQGERTNQAEILSSSLPDPDSDPNVGAGVDDLGDGIADDDEASATVILSGSGATLSGTVFLDNGAGGGVAHDGLQNGAEPINSEAVIILSDDLGAPLGVSNVAPDGSWSFALPEGYADKVTITVQPNAGLIPISENAGALPALDNPEARDGSLAFTPVVGASYGGIDFGILREARLIKDQTAAIAPGQLVLLPHDYIADSTGSVTFSLVERKSVPEGAFSAALFADSDCDGAPETPINDPVAVSAGTRLCVIVRVSASSGIASGASLAFDVVAETAYEGTDITETDINSDLVSSDGAQGRLILRKTVNNLTQATGEGTSNAGTIGDVLEYRIYLENPGPVGATNVIIYDRTPPYTALAGPITSPVSITDNLSCLLAAPAANTADYVGPLRWECTGTLPPGDSGALDFQVKISP